MPDSIRTRLSASGVLQHVILSPEIDLMLSGLEVTGATTDLGGGVSTGSVTLKTDLSRNPIPGFDFALTLPAVVKPAPYKLRLEANSFQFWLVLADQEQVLFIFKFLRGAAGLALTGATRTDAVDGTVTLDALPPDDPKFVPVLVSRASEPGAALGPALLVSGSADQPASTRFTPNTDSTQGIVTLGLEPRTVVFGTSKIGFDCPAVIIDDSDEAKGPGDGAPGLDPPLPTISADTPGWRGILARQLDFYLPADIPLFGGRPIKGYLAIPTGHGGVELVIQTTVPPRPEAPERPGYAIRIECIDPTATGLSGLLPTLISASMELPLDGAKGDFATGGGNQGVTFAAGKPVRATATFARDPVNAADTFTIGIGVAAQGQEGLISVTSTAMGGAKIFNTAAALATALIADKDVERKADVGDTKGVVLYSLLAAGTALSSLFTDDSHFVLHGVEIESTGHGFPIGGPVVLTLDYSVAVRVTQISVGVLSVSMNPDQPMRIRVSKARMSVDPDKSGLSMIGLDFDHAGMEIENPGAWNVEGLESLFDVLASRSGRGSSWLEVDLGFKLNLGPIKVSGATIRATLNDVDGSITASIRGLEAGLTIPGAVEGTGALQLRPRGFAASLRASLLPLNLSADAGIIYAPPMIVLRLDVDLPAPLPLANSGFGLLGIGGLLGFSAVPDYGGDAGLDPVVRQLKWQPNDEHSFKEARGESTFGLFAAVGTLPDLGVTFSAKAGLLITVPDIAIRGALNGKVLQPPTKIDDKSYPPSAGISFLGFIGVDSEALSFGLLGEVNLSPLLDVKVPLAGHFPFKNDASDWYIYLGADGAAVEGRSIGPISARVLPGILDVGADAYIMLRGKGISGWPNGRALPCGPIDISDGFVVAFGFGIQNTFGIKPIVWAELYASLDLLIGAKPPTLAGFGRAGGGLNLGPFGLGVQAQVSFMVRSGQSFFWAEVSGRIEFFFFDIEGTVTISFGEKPEITLPPPDLHPLDRLDSAGNRAGSLGTLIDDTYRVVAQLVEDPDRIDDTMQVWPDVIVSLPFAISPAINQATAGTQFPGVGGPVAVPPPAKVGTEMLHYSWRLDRLELVDVTGEADKFAGAGTRPPGQLAAAWQVARIGGGGDDISELLLFSKSPDVWINRLADGGAGMPGNPLQQGANTCQRSVSAEMGWAIGLLAGQDRPGFRLPPDPISRNPLVSRIEARMRHYGLNAQNAAVALDQLFSLPEPFSLSPAQLVTWRQAAKVERVFEGHIVAPNLRWLDGRDPRELSNGEHPYAWQQFRLDLTEPAVEGRLVLVADRALFGIRENFFGLRVFDDIGSEWANPDLVDGPGNATAGLFHAPNPSPVRQLIVSYPIGRAVGVAGVGGVTVSARNAAAVENQAIADESARQAAAAAAGPKTDPGTNTPHQRAILEPGRLYRIDIDMVWAGEISKQNESGQIVPVKQLGYDGRPATEPSAGRYDPKGGAAGTPTKRQLFFRTTPRPAAPLAEKYGDTKFHTWLNRQQDVFQPEMLQRYLAGYNPVQSEEFWFCDDPLRAHFLQDHVAALAKAYGFDLQVAVRRVDRPGAAYALPLLFLPNWTFGNEPKFLGPVDQLRYAYAKASPCKVPLPGATAAVTTPLEEEAWYDVHVLAKSADPAFTDGKLPGVTFRTSRWRTPGGMLAGLGLATSGQAAVANVMTGDLAVTAPASLAPAVVEDDDQAYQNALHALGLDGWPVAQAPRLSRLWVPGPASSWLFAGLIVESPEPVHRPGRLELGGLRLEMGNAGAAIRFDIRRRDRSGARLIYLTATPFRVVTRERVVAGLPAGGGLGGIHRPLFRNITPQLMLDAKGKLLDAVTDMTGTLVIPAAPGFLEDP